MCNLYSLNKNKEAVATMFRVGHNRMPQLDLPLPFVAPGKMAPIVRTAEDGAREIASMSWGFIRPIPGRVARRVTNARDDEVARGNRFWRSNFEKRRCLVPATTFCEPHEDIRPATWHWFAIKGADPRPLFAFAGFWSRTCGVIRKNTEPVELDTYTFMTTVPNAVTMAINHERSPVLLTTDAEFETWLSGTPEEALSLVKPFDAEKMHIVQEGMSREDNLVLA